MVDVARPLFDYPEPCSCYAEGYSQGKDKAYFEVLPARWTAPPPGLHLPTLSPKPSYRGAKERIYAIPNL